MAATSQHHATRVLDTLEAGGVALFPADVGYAIVGNTETAIERIYAAKRRSYDKACGMFSNWDMVRRLALLDEPALAMIDAVIHGHGLPLSVVVPFRVDHPFFTGLAPRTRALSSRGATIDMLLNAGSLHDAIARESWHRGVPVLGSSANQSLSGSKYILSDVEPAVRQAADFVIDGGRTRYSHPAGMGSTIVALPSCLPIREGIRYAEICDVLAAEFGLDPRRATMAGGAS